MLNSICEYTKTRLNTDSICMNFTIFGQAINTPMKRLYRILLMTIIGLYPALSTMAQASHRVYVPKPGTLSEMIPPQTANNISHLILQGNINAIDFKYLREEFKMLRVLDLSKANISRYTGKRGTQTERFCLYPANNIPAYAFCPPKEDSTYSDKSSLEHVILPEHIKKIEEYAFKACKNLDICQIRRQTPPVLMPEALADSLTAIFVPTGCGNTYQSNAQWKHFAIIEGEPINVTVKLKNTENLTEKLQRKAIQPTSINFLTIEGKLDETDFALIRDFMPNLVSVNLSESYATSIPEYTFTQKKYMLKITLPKGLKSIGQRAFSGCTRLAGTLVLPPEVTAIEYGAFMGCQRLHCVLATGNKITTVGDKLFGEEENKLIYK